MACQKVVLMVAPMEFLLVASLDVQLVVLSVAPMETHLVASRVA
jgi:hypothetical protein